MADPKIRYDILANAEGSAGVENLARELEKLDAAIDPSTAARAKELAAELRSLGQQQQAVDQFRAIKERSQEAGQALQAAQEAAQAYARSLPPAIQQTKAQAGQLEKLRDSVRSAKTEQLASVQAVQAQRQALAAAGIETEKLNVHQAELTRQSIQLRQATASVGAAYQQQANQATAAAATQVGANKKVADSVGSIAGQLRSLQTIAQAAIGGQLLGGLAGDLAKTSDEFQNLQSRIRLVTGEGAAFDSAWQGVLDVANRTNSSLETTGLLFARIAAAGKSIGVTNADALRLTESINQALTISGASAESSSAAVTQLLQGLQSGVLRGDEFNSVMEQSPRLAKALADGLGVTTGELRKLAEAGQLTSTTVIESLQGQSAALQSEFDKIPLTIGRSIQSLSNAWTVYVGEASKATGASATVANAIGFVAKNLDTLGALLYGAGKAALAYQAIKLAATFLDVGAAARASAAAVTAQTAAVVANTAAAQANAVAGAGAAASASRFAGALSAIKLFSVVGILTNFREIGTAIGEGTAKLLGYGKVFEEAERKQLADEVATRANAAAKAQLAQQIQLAAEKTLGLTEQSRKLIGEFTAVTAKGGEVSEALDKISKSLELGNLNGIRNGVTALDALAEQGKITGAQIREALAAALKNEDLNVFKINALAAFDQTEQGARRLKEAIDAISTEALRRAGTSLEELTTGFSKGATTAINDLDALSETLNDLKLSGEDAGRVLATALDKAVDAASTERAIEAVIERLKSLGEQGRISGQQLADGLEKARKKIDDLKPGIQSLDEALRNFGLKTRTELQGTAEKLGESYKKIAYSAGVSLADQRKAFEQYSAAAIAANGGVETSAVKVARTVLEIREAALSAGQAGVEAGVAIKAEFESVAAGIASASRELDTFSDAGRKARSARISAESAAEEKKQAETGGYGSYGVQGQLKIAEGEFFDKKAFEQAMGAYWTSVAGTTSSWGLGAPDPQVYVRAIAGSLRGRGPAGPGERPLLPQTTDPAAGNAAPTTVIVKVQTASGVYNVPTTDADALLAAINASARAAGGSASRVGG
jgi:tape measure domain-containing protein